MLSETTFDANTTSFADVQPNSGQVHVYNKLDDKFIFLQNIKPTQNIPEGFDFGSAMAISKLNVYVGASLLDGSASTSGRFFMYQKLIDSLGWETVATQPDLVDVNKVKKAFCTTLLLTYSLHNCL